MTASEESAAAVRPASQQPAGMPPVTLDGLRAHAMADAVLPRRWGALYVMEARLRGMRGYLQTIIWTAIGTPVLYLYAMGLGLGSLVAANLGPDGIDGVDYLVFLGPALLVTAATTVASEEFSYPIFQGFKWNPVFFAMNATPLSPGQIIDGVVLSVAARLFGASAVYYAVLLAFGAVPNATGLWAIGVGVLAGLAFGTPVMAYVATLHSEGGQISMVMRFVLMPLTLFSGTFYPLETMPSALQWIGWISPLWHGAQLARVATYGLGEPPWLIATHVVYLTVLAVVGWLLARRFAVVRLNR